MPRLVADVRGGSDHPYQGFGVDANVTCDEAIARDR
jgi:hypothetical protein